MSVSAWICGGAVQGRLCPACDHVMEGAAVPSSARTVLLCRRLPGELAGGHGGECWRPAPASSHITGPGGAAFGGGGGGRDASIAVLAGSETARTRDLRDLPSIPLPCEGHLPFPAPAPPQGLHDVDRRCSSPKLHAVCALQY